MYSMDWDIRFYKDGKAYRLGLLAECEVECSVENLTDRATIILPEAVLNRVLNLEEQLPEGTPVTIKLGYDGNLENEFEGHVKDVTTNDSTLKINCEDSLYLFRKGVKNEELKPTSVKKIAQRVIDQIDRSFTLKCDYDIPYEKFVIHHAEGYDVLKKLQEETRANIYFDNQNKVLHIHPPYVEKGGEVRYLFQQNIESSSLEYKKAHDKKIEVTIEGVDLNGKVTSVTVGNTGGEKITRKVSSIPPGGLKLMADTEYKNRVMDGYEGSFDTWLIPMVRPTYSAWIEDRDYPYKSGWYYVVSVKTNFSPSGGKRTIQLGIKLSNG